MSDRSPKDPLGDDVGLTVLLNGSAVIRLHLSTKDAARVPLVLAMRGKRRCKLIGIAICLLQTLTALSRNIFHSLMLGLHIKNAPSAY